VYDTSLYRKFYFLQDGMHGSVLESDGKRGGGSEGLGVNIKMKRGGGGRVVGAMQV
jgi:hypothetical protein